MWYIYIPIIVVVSILLIALVSYVVYKYMEQKKHEAELALLNNAFEYMKISKSNFEKLFAKYDKGVVVKSRQTLDKYDYSSFFKDNRNYFQIIRELLADKDKYIVMVKDFLKTNPFMEEKEYPFVYNCLTNAIRFGSVFVIKVMYITKAGNCLANKLLSLDINTLNQIESSPELYMTKAEIKEIEKEKLDVTKKEKYSRVNGIIEKANLLKRNLITKQESKTLDDLIAKLFDRTVNSIQKIKQLDSDEWVLIDIVINDIEKNVTEIEEKNRRLRDYYGSKDFSDLKKTCELLINSQKDFNSYIEEKIESISKSFGTRIVRNETEHDDVYNYVRTYNKTVSPFTAELSSNVFSSAENNPMQYLIKYFYPEKSLYKEQIIGLKNLLNELESLKDAKCIIDNYKKDYLKYMQNVPSFVLDDDEDGFYSRLGFAVIDENVLNVEYKFVYTSGGGMAQRSFTISMTEENIGELINQLQNKLSSASLAKEQRALMTPKLRLHIKERDNYTCCICGNSSHVEPNLLLEIDHIIPIAKGGLTVEDNLQTLCWKCNRIKGAKI